MVSKTPLPRRGLTVIDVLAISGCAAIVLLVLGPAILHARSQARNNGCISRLKLISNGLQNYHSTYNCFSPGFVSRYRDGDSQAAFGWQTALLPFIDQAPLYNILNFSNPLPAPDKYLSMGLELYLCPEDAGLPAENSYRGGYGRSSYSGNMGDLAPPRWADGRMEAFWPGAVATFPTGRTNSQGVSRFAALNVADMSTFMPTGVFGWNSRFSIRDAVDGASHTICIGERSKISGWGIWPGVGSNRYENDVLTDVSYASVINSSATGFSSPHDGGVFVGLVDGSVRFLSNDIESRPNGGVLQHLGNRADGAVIPPDAFGRF